MTSPTFSRRDVLITGAASAAAAALPRAAAAQERRFEPRVGPWRTFELATTVNVLDVQGTTRVWLPVPDVESDYQRGIDNAWTGNAASVRLVADRARGTRMLYAEFPASVSAPTLRLTSRVQTRSRAVDWTRAAPVREDPALLRANLAAHRAAAARRHRAQDRARRDARRCQRRRQGARDLRLGGGQRLPRTRRRAAAAPATSRPCSKPATWAASAPT